MTGRKEAAVVNLVRIGVLLLAAVFLILGICRGEHMDVYGKAVRICLECIGIG